MLRSILARPHPLLSRLRRHDGRSMTQLGRGRADAIPSQGYYTWPSEDETFDQPEAPEPVAAASSYGCISPSYYGRRRRHLYLVLDDWRKGFTIHKLDVDDGSDGGGDLALRTPVHRLATTTSCGLFWNFAALGSKIVAAGRLIRGDYVAHVYDTETAALHIVPGLPPTLRGRWHLDVVAGNCLHVYGRTDEHLRWWRDKGGMHRLEEAVTPSDREGWGDRWSWSSLLSPPPFFASHFKSVAVHPEEGGRTLFVSVDRFDEDIPEDRDPSDPDSPSRTAHTYSYDMVRRGWKDHVKWDPSHPDNPTRTAHTYSYDTVSGEWKDHGEWDLPFSGQAHYDKELEAWVGLNREHGYDSPDGYVCSCDVPSLICSPRRPAWRISSERLFNPSTSSASLVYMGVDSTYCLVEVTELERFSGDKCKCVIRLAVFRLRYNKNGNLAATTLRPDRFYPFSKYDEDFNVRAF